MPSALRTSREKGLDLVLITQKANPPICKMIEYGKYLYQQRKKAKQGVKRDKTGELKNVRLGFNISDHDLGIRAKMAERFLKKGYKVRIELKLQGREKWLQNFAREKMKKFLKILTELIPLTIEKGIERKPRGLTMIVDKAKIKPQDLPKKDN